MTMIIREYFTGKVHRRAMRNCSCRYSVEGNYLVVRDYWSDKLIHRFNVSKYGSIDFWIED